MASTSTAFTVSGMALTGNETVRVLVALSSSGPWTEVGTAESDANPVTASDGTEFFPFTTTVTVPTEQWDGNRCQGAITYLKVRNSVNWDLPTVNETSPNGKPFFDCFNDEMEFNGRTAISAILYCDAPDSPVTHVTVPAAGTPFDYTGSVTISTMAQADQWVCLRDLTGDLNIPSSGLEQIELPVLESVTGDASLVYDRPGLTYLEPTRTIALPALSTVGGDLNLSSPAAAPSQIIQFRVGLDALTSVGGSVDISAHAFNTDLYGLRNL
ncbi:MAG: hypothetical protein AAF449_20760, partial [Myxococcota bacterium]